MLLKSILPVFIMATLYSTGVGQDVVRKDFFVASTDGVTLSVREILPDHSADVKGRYPVVLIHGAGGGGTSSFDLPLPNGSFAADLAARGFRVYLINIRGWEGSSRPAYDETDKTLVAGSVQEAEQDIDAVVHWICKQNRTKKVSLFGWATGGHWAGYYTSRHPEKVAHLVILNSLYGVSAPWAYKANFQDPADTTRFYYTNFSTFRTSARRALTAAWTASIPGTNKSLWQDSLLTKAYEDAAVSFYADGILKVPGGYRVETFYLSNGRKYWDAEQITAPTLVMRGELDFWSRPEDLTALCADLVHAKRKACVVIPDGTHALFLSRPEKGRSMLLERTIAFLK
jgi:pimeloyl-ACP methyl ester carboxylesterase